MGVVVKVNERFKFRDVFSYTFSFLSVLEMATELTITYLQCVCSWFCQWYQWYTNIVQGLPMVPLVIPLVPLVPLVKTVGSQYFRQSTVWAKLPSLESHMIQYCVLNFKFINFTNMHCFYQGDISKKLKKVVEKQ